MGSRVLVGSIAFACVACGMSSSVYDWDPKLKATEGRLGGFLADVPLGPRGGIQEVHPDIKSDGVIRVTNIDDLSAFLTRQEQPKTSALAWYRNSDDEPYAFVYLALVAPGTSPNRTKSETSIGHPSWLAGPSAAHMSVTYTARPIEGISVGDSCKLYAVFGSIDGAGAEGVLVESALSWVTLAGSKRNLYLEIAVPGDVGTSTVDRYQRGPLKAKLDAARPMLDRLRAAHDKVGLDVCAVP